MTQQRDPEVSIAAYAAASNAEPQPAWRTLDVIRESGFTGEITFHSIPQVTAYADGGTIYHAERADDPAIGQRLLEADVLTAQQLERGRVRVGDVEHLGRMFDRDSTIDRDAVMVIVEAATEELVQELAASVVAPISISAYRHHPSGVHRWFVAPMEPATRRPVSGVNQVDRSVVDELPDVTAPGADVRIEWNQSAAGGAPADPDAPATAGRIDVGEIDIEAELDRFDADSADWMRRGEPSDDAGDDAWVQDFQIVWPDGTEEPAVESDRPAPLRSAETRLDPPAAAPDALSAPPDPDSAPLAASPDSAPSPSVSTPDALSAPPDPDSAPLAASPDSAPSPSVSTPDALSAPPDPDSAPSTAPSASMPPPPAPAPDALAPPLGRPTAPTSDAPLPPPAASAAAMPAAESGDDAPDGVAALARPRLVIEGDPAADAHVPEDVADAVRRALQAIENAATASATLPQIDLAPITLPDLALPSAPDDAEPLTEPPRVVTPAQVEASIEAVESIETLRPPEPPVASGFAPPSVDARAEVMYARAAAAATAVDAQDAPVDQVDAAVGRAEASIEPPPEPGQASVVFVDEDDEDGSSRRGALRRLIGSLRKHH